ncbi:hypothetical protein D1P53_003221 [Cryptococcus gattii VGV]|nr:hypothetical protein D1P53_003221 [Cryptococcus gattii VGV]
MISTGTTEEDGASMRASALTQFISDSRVTSLFTPSNSDPLLSPLPSPVRALPEHPKSPRDNPTTNGGHPKNNDRPYPLSLIPFDLSEPYEVSKNFTIRSYDEICQVDHLDQNWVMDYNDGMIDDEQSFHDGYVRRYLDRFTQEKNRRMGTMFAHQANLKAVFYDRKDEEWAKLELVDEYRRHTGKVLGVPSQSRSTSRSKKDGATTPDASLIGYVKDPSSPSGWKRKLYAVIELKWLKLATHLAGEDKRRFDEKALRYLCQEGVFQTMWYVILGFAISRCTFGLSIANEYFYRIVYLGQSSTSDDPVLALEADGEFLEKARPHFPPDGYSVDELAELTDFWSSPPNCLIIDRANSILNKEARYRLDATILFFLAHAASLSKQDSTGGLPFPLAHIPTQATAYSATRMRLEGLKAGHRRHTFHLIKGKKRKWTVSNEEEEDEEEKEEENTSGQAKPPGKDNNDGSQGGNSGSGGDSSRGEGSGSGGGSGSGARGSARGVGGGSSSHRAEAFGGTSMTRQTLKRSLERLSAPEGISDVKTSIIASLISNSHVRCSGAPSSLGTDSSGSLDSSFDTSFNTSFDTFFDTSSNSKHTLVLDDLPTDPPPEFNKTDPIDIDLDDIDPESGELTLAAYKDRLAMLGRNAGQSAGVLAAVIFSMMAILNFVPINLEVLLGPLIDPLVHHPALLPWYPLTLTIPNTPRNLICFVNNIMERVAVSGGGGHGAFGTEGAIGTGGGGEKIRSARGGEHLRVFIGIERMVVGKEHGPYRGVDGHVKVRATGQSWIDHG